MQNTNWREEDAEWVQHRLDPSTLQSIIMLKNNFFYEYSTAEQAERYVGYEFDESILIEHFILFFNYGKKQSWWSDEVLNLMKKTRIETEIYVRSREKTLKEINQANSKL